MKNSTTPLEELIQKPRGYFSGNLLAPPPSSSLGGARLSSAMGDDASRLAQHVTLFPAWLGQADH